MQFWTENSAKSEFDFLVATFIYLFICFHFVHRQHDCHFLQNDIFFYLSSFNNFNSTKTIYNNSTKKNKMNKRKKKTLRFILSLLFWFFFLFFSIFSFLFAYFFSIKWASLDELNSIYRSAIRSVLRFLEDWGILVVCNSNKAYMLVYKFDWLVVCVRVEATIWLYWWRWWIILTFKRIVDWLIYSKLFQRKT